MKIEAIDTYLVSMPLKYPFRTAFGNNSTIESVLVRITSEGVSGWGEAAPWGSPGYSPEYSEGAFNCINSFIAPLLVGKDISSGDELQQVFGIIKGNQFAKAAIDLAWWDLYAKLCQMPLWKCIGGTQPSVQVGADFGVMETFDMLIAEIDASLVAGYKRVKLKYRPGWDLDMIKAVRSTFPDDVFHIDCNSAYTLQDVPMFEQLDRYNLAMIEQPFAHNDIHEHAKLAKQIKTPICLDESIVDLRSALTAIDTHACGYINIKPGRVGGLTVACKIHDLCYSHQIPCWVGGMLESAVGASHCLALATLPDFLYPNDIFPSNRFYEDDIGRPEMELSAPSTMTASNVPGCGVEPDMGELLNRLLAHKVHGTRL